MSHVTLVRHGQANTHAKDEISYDQLSDLGRQQARWLGDHLRGTGDVFARAYSGTLQRHRETAAEMGLALEVEQDARLNELEYFTMAQLMDQQHGCTVAMTPGTGDAAVASPAPAPPADALVTDRTDEALVVLVADCVPLLLVDRTEGLAAAVHAGRPGLLAGVVPAALQTLGELGARRLEAVVGPSVCPRCYEVPEHLRDEAAALTPAAAAVSWTGTPAIDVASGVVQQLADSDLEVSLRWLPGCTRERDDLYSYRRDGQTGRMASIIWMAE